MTIEILAVIECLTNHADRFLFQPFRKGSNLQVDGVVAGGMDQIVERARRAFFFGTTSLVGAYLAGAHGGVLLAPAFLVAAFFLFNALTAYATGMTALLVVWGGLVSLGVGPGAETLLNFSRPLLADMRLSSNHPESPAMAGQISGSNNSLVSRLKDLKEACDAKLLAADECEASRRGILSHFQSAE